MTRIVLLGGGYVTLAFGNNTNLTAEADPVSLEIIKVVCPLYTGELKVHDGPYAETREQFGGFYIIEAADMDEALAWAKKCPAAQWGPVEVRALIPGF